MKHQINFTINFYNLYLKFELDITVLCSYSEAANKPLISVTNVGARVTLSQGSQQGIMNKGESRL